MKVLDENLRITEECYNSIKDQVERNIVINKIGRDDYMAMCDMTMVEGDDTLKIREIVSSASSQSQAKSYMESKACDKIKKFFTLVYERLEREKEIAELRKQINGKMDEITDIYAKINNIQ